MILFSLKIHNKPPNNNVQFVQKITKNAIQIANLLIIRYNVIVIVFLMVFNNK